MAVRNDKTCEACGKQRHRNCSVCKKGELLPSRDGLIDHVTKALHVCGQIPPATTAQVVLEALVALIDERIRQKEA